MAFSIFWAFFASSAFVPLQVREAFDGSLQPSTANSSRPIRPCSSQTNSTSRNTDVISPGIRAMNAAMVVKCGALSPDKAMNTTFSRQARSMEREEVSPRA